MSVLENQKGRVSAKPPTPAGLLKELSVIEAELVTFEDQRGVAALEAHSGDAVAVQRLQTVNKELGVRREKVETLRAAHKAAVVREEQDIAAQRYSLQKSQMMALKKHIETRNKAAADLADAIAKAGAAYRALQTHSIGARNATPIGLTFPEVGDSFGDKAIEKLVVGELWRTSAQPNDKDGFKLPGAHFTDLAYQHAPERTPALADAIKAGSDHVLSRLKLKVPE